MGVEIHFHLLPGLDDGPSSIEESVELARAALVDGTSTVVATPHVRGDWVTDVLELEERVAEVRSALAAAKLELEVRCGGELGHDMVGRLSQRELEAIAQGPRGARWLLLESPWGAFGSDFHEAAAELRDRGFGVVIAHPERSADAELDRSAGLRKELRAGSLAQLNALSLTGGHGPGAEAAAIRLLKRGRVSLVASDAHGPTRPPALGAAARVLRELGADPGVADALTRTAPTALLARGMTAGRALAA